VRAARSAPQAPSRLPRRLQFLLRLRPVGFPGRGISGIRAIGELPPPLRRRLWEQASRLRGEGFCPLLLDERCGVYADRPLICRTQGLPLLLETGAGKPALDVCPLNFTAPGALERIGAEHAVDLDALNLQLAA